ncbi:TMEM144 [Symbiodinium sp. CCMP2456]|nr:TMEM144 [Symbiodinium sp. CCMP2456]
MQKREVPMMRVVQKGGLWVTLDNRRLAVYKMARHSGKCRDVKVNLVQLSDVEGELRKKSDSRVEGLSVTVRGTKRTVHADGRVTEGPQLSDGQLQHRADMGGHWTQEQLQAIGEGIRDFEAVVKQVLGPSAKLVRAGSFMKGTDIAGESDIDVMVFGAGPITEQQWNLIVSGIKSRGYVIDSVNPRCIHVTVNKCLVTIEFDVVANHRQGFPPNKEPENPFRNNREAARAVRNIKLDFQESGEKGFSGNDIEQAVLNGQKTLQQPGLGKLIDAAKAALKSERAQQLKRPRTAAHENDASAGTTDFNTPIGEGSFRKVYKGQYTQGIRAGQAKVSKVFKDGKEAYEDQFFDQGYSPSR